MSNEVEEIKAKIDLAELISEYVRLSPAGINNFRGLCPFHNEKTPSFMVSRDKGIWHCFGCGAGGDVFEFVMKIEGWDFPEALKFLADKASVTLQNRKSENQENKRSLYDLCALAAKYWHKVLIDSSVAQEAREYLNKRGLDSDTISEWQIGYAPESWDNLFKFLVKRGFKEREIFEAGLLVKKPQGYGFYDRFRNRIMFPLTDASSRVVGFSGRALKKDELAKYINTPQTLIYNKSAVVFGLDKAKRAIKEQDGIVIVEGQMDVIASHQYGFRNTVGSSGTALTTEQVKLLSRYSKNLLFALDADAAGQKAIDHGEDVVRNFISSSASITSVDKLGRLRRFIDPLLEYSINLKVIEIPSGKDPDECLRNNPDEWRQAVENAKPIMQYYFDKVFKEKNINQPEERKAIIQFLLNKISKIGDNIERDYWLKNLAQRASVSEAVLRETAGKFRTKAAGQQLAELRRENPNRPAQAARKPLDYLVWQQILALILAFPQLVAKVAEEPLADILEEKVALDLYKKIIFFYTKSIDLFAPSAVDNSEFDLFEEFSNWLKNEQAGKDALESWNEAFLLSQKDFQELDFKTAKEELGNLVKILKSNSFNRRLNVLKLELEEAEKNHQKERINQLLTELSEVINRKAQLL